MQNFYYRIRFLKQWMQFFCHQTRMDFLYFHPLKRYSDDKKSAYAFSFNEKEGF